MATLSSEAPEVVQVLLASRADIHHIADSGACILSTACCNENAAVGVVSQLVEASAEINCRQTPRTFKWRAVL